MKLHEEKTVSLMVALYCRKKHGLKRELCGSCTALLDYALKKLVSCPLKPDKPVCSNCTIHCYVSQQREAIREVMRFSGPRLTFKNPFIALAYLMNKKLRRQNSGSDTQATAEHHVQT